MNFKKVVADRAEALGVESEAIEKAFARFLSMMGEQEIKMFLSDMQCCGNCDCK